MDNDLQLAIKLHNQLNSASSETPTKKLKKSKYDKDSCIVDPEWEITDPNPDIHMLFQVFDKKYFWGRLDCVEVKWSPRMYSCAGICTYKGKWGGCVISLSLPLLKLRPRKDLVETLLHEMIHAFLFVADKNRDRGEHGPKFHEHMHRINKDAGTKITVYHTFHDEVKHYKQHWWRCNGPCQEWKPFFGFVKRSMNRAPAPNDFWFADHKTKCGGEFIKIKEPENFKSRKRGLDKKLDTVKKQVSPLAKYFNGTSKSSPPSTSNSSNTSSSPSSSGNKKNGSATSLKNFGTSKTPSPTSGTKRPFSSTGPSSNTTNNKTGSAASLKNFFSGASKTPSPTSGTKRPFSNTSSSSNTTNNKNGAAASITKFFPEVPKNKPTGEIKTVNNNNSSAKIESHKKISNVHGFTNLSKPGPSSSSVDKKKGTGFGGTGLKLSSGGGSKVLVQNPRPSTSADPTQNIKKPEDISIPKSQSQIVPFSGNGYVLGNPSGSAPDRSKSRLLLAFDNNAKKTNSKVSESKLNKETFENDIDMLTHIPLDLEEVCDESRGSQDLVHCPVCNKGMPEFAMNEHLDSCVGLENVFENSTILIPSDDEDAEELPPDLEPGTVNCPVCGCPCPEKEINAHLDVCLK